MVLSGVLFGCLSSDVLLVERDLASRSCLSAMMKVAMLYYPGIVMVGCPLDDGRLDIANTAVSAAWTVRGRSIGFVLG